MHSALTWPRWQTLPIRRHLPDAAAFALRLWLAQEFAFAGWTKLSGGITPPDWFAELMFPWPWSALPATVNWVSAGALELVFALALLVGMRARWAAAGLLLITVVAVLTVHADLGWAGWNAIESDQGNGYKVPLMIGLMLAVICAQGPGRWAWRD